MVFIVALYVPLCRHLESLPDVQPELYADNLKCCAERPGALFDSARLSGRSVRTFLLESVFFSALLNLFVRL